MAKNLKPVKVIFRDKSGKFLPQEERFDEDKVGMVQVVRNGIYTILAENALKPKDLVQVLSQREYESLKEATVHVKTYTSKSKYKAWDIAGQIDKTKKIRRQQIKLTVTIMDGKQQKQFSFYHQIKRNSASSYSLFRRINEELGWEGVFLYDRIHGKMMADRKGKKVSLKSIRVDKVI